MSSKRKHQTSVVARAYDVLPALRRLVASGRARLLRSRLARLRGTQEAFAFIYEHNAWRNPESVSGSGSTIQATELLRVRLAAFLAQHHVRTLLDAPCGDFNWFRLVARPPGMHYVGGDVVPALVARCHQAYGNATTRFLQLDITKDPLPAADLWLCRDALVHFSFADIFSVLRNALRNSRIGQILMTTHDEGDVNRDIVTGDWRALNMRKEPFCLPQPEVSLEDSSGGQTGKCLGLWSRGAIEECIRRRTEPTVGS